MNDLLLAIPLSLAVGAFAMWLYMREKVLDARADAAVTRAMYKVKSPFDGMADAIHRFNADVRRAMLGEDRP